MTTTLRPINPTDAPILARLHSQSWFVANRGLLSDEFLDTTLDQNRFELWLGRMEKPSASQYGFIALREGEPVGFVFAEPAREPAFGTLIDNIHVLPNLKGGGIGRALLARLCEVEEVQRPGRGFYLWVFRANAQARRFYDRIGGRVESESTVVAADDQVREVCRYVWPSSTAMKAALL
jgi:GNAT superfamily N-acetyltransferase